MQVLKTLKPKNGIYGNSCGNCGKCGECTEERVILPVGIVAKELTPASVMPFTVGGCDRKVISYKIRNAGCNCIIQVIADNVVIEELLPGEQFAEAVDSHFYYDFELKLKFVGDATLNPSDLVVCKVVFSERIIKC